MVMTAQNIPTKELCDPHSNADQLSDLPSRIKNRNLAMLDTSVPKGPLLALAVSLLVGIVTATVISRFISNAGILDTSTILPALAGAVIGSLGFSRLGASPILLGLVFALIGVPFKSYLIPFAVSCASSLAVISLYHGWSFAKNR
jgi:hypothetical protein